MFKLDVTSFRFGKSRRAVETLGNEFMDKINEKLIRMQIEFDKLKKHIDAKSKQMANDSDRCAKKSSEINKSIELFTKAMKGDKNAIIEKYKTFADMQKLLNANVIRSATLTEVAHFMYRNAPECALDAVMKIITLHYEPDAFWEANKNKAVWEWAAMLYPEYADKWKELYKDFTFEGEDDESIFEKRL